MFNYVVHVEYIHYQNRKVPMNYTKVLVPAFMLLASTVCSAKEIINLTSQTDINNAINGNAMLVIDYHAESHCAPCQQMAKILPEIANEFSNIQFAKVDVNVFDVAEIQSVPTFVFYSDHKEVKRFSGSRSKASFTTLLNESFSCCGTTRKGKK